MKETFYIRALKFVLLYRDCLLRIKGPAPGLQTKKSVAQNLDDIKKIKIAAIPKICNEFVLNYCE